MRYIKYFEEKELPISKLFKYNIGDYLWLRGDDWEIFRCVKVLNCGSNYERDWEQTLEDYYVKAIMLPGKENNNQEIIEDIWIDWDDILRKAKPDEIKKFEYYLNILKYNL